MFESKLNEPLDLEAEAQLEPGLKFNSGDVGPGVRADRSNNIFLTGATGFLGAFLLEELLQQTTAKIYCLVRPPSKPGLTSAGRLKQCLQSFSLWQSHMESRIIAVEGDLSAPLLGLSPQRFRHMAETVDVIFHNGAYVNFFRPYAALKDINVRGTHEVLRLAGLAKTKPLHFISSMAVFIGRKTEKLHTIYERDISEPALLKSGYEQSKWVAEQMIRHAQELGLPTSIYRPIRIMGHTRTGVTGNFHDMLCSMLKACTQMGVFPALDVEVPLVPVDYVSRGVVYLSRQDYAAGSAFHFSHPRPIPWKQFMKEILSMGYDLEEISYEQWYEALTNRARQDPKNRLFSSLTLYLRLPNYFLAKKPKFNSSRTMAYLKEADIICPDIDSQLISTYISYFQNSGHLPFPGKREQCTHMSTKQ